MNLDIQATIKHYQDLHAVYGNPEYGMFAGALEQQHAELIETKRKYEQVCIERNDLLVENIELKNWIGFDKRKPPLGGKIIVLFHYINNPAHTHIGAFIFVKGAEEYLLKNDDIKLMHWINVPELPEGFCL